jgi:hypothetical protein
MQTCYIKILEGFEVIGYESRWGVHWRVAYFWCCILQWCRIPYPYYLQWQLPMRSSGIVIALKEAP